jgi:hypothetical protein
METLHLLLLQKKCNGTLPPQPCNDAHDARVQCREAVETNFEKLVLRCKNKALDVPHLPAPPTSSLT